VFKKEAKLKKKEKKKAAKKAKKRCKAACKAIKKMTDKAKKEAEDAAKKSGAAIKEQVKRIKESTGKDTTSEIEALKKVMKGTGESAREELKTAVAEDLVTKNETAKKELEGLGDKILEEDKAMFDQAKAHEIKLAEEVQKLVWDQGLQSGYDGSMELSAKAAEEAHNISKDEVLPAWTQSFKDAGNAKNVSTDSLHSILTMWQTAVTKSHQDWSKVSAAFDSANMASRLAHDTQVQVVSGLELSRLLRDTSVFYKADAKEAYDRSAALLNKANADYAVTQRNARLIAGLEDATADAQGVAQRAIDAAKKVSTEVEHLSK